MVCLFALFVFSFCLDLCVEQDEEHGFDSWMVLLLCSFIIMRIRLGSGSNGLVFCSDLFCFYFLIPTSASGTAAACGGALTYTNSFLLNLLCSLSGIVMPFHG